MAADSVHPRRGENYREIRRNRNREAGLGGTDVGLLSSQMCGSPRPKRELGQLRSPKYRMNNNRWQM